MKGAVFAINSGGGDFQYDKRFLTLVCSISLSFDLYVPLAYLLTALQTNFTCVCPISASLVYILEMVPDDPGSILKDV